VSAISAGNAASLPLRWQTRHKAVLTLPEGASFQPDLDDQGLLSQIQLDLGQVISATPRLSYPDVAWGDSYNNQLPVKSERDVLIEYTRIRGRFSPGRPHGPGGRGKRAQLAPAAAGRPGDARVTLRVVERQGAGRCRLSCTSTPSGRVLPPVDRHRIPNTAWFEDYSVISSMAETGGTR